MTEGLLIARQGYYFVVHASLRVITGLVTLNKLIRFFFLSFVSFLSLFNREARVTGILRCSDVNIVIKTLILITYM